MAKIAGTTTTAPPITADNGAKAMSKSGSSMQPSTIVVIVRWSASQSGDAKHSAIDLSDGATGEPHSGQTELIGNVRRLYSHRAQNTSRATVIASASMAGTWSVAPTGDPHLAQTPCRATPQSVASQPAHFRSKSITDIQATVSLAPSVTCDARSPVSYPPEVVESITGSRRPDMNGTPTSTRARHLAGPAQRNIASS